MSTLTVTCYSWPPSSGDDLFTCVAISRPPHHFCFTTSQPVRPKEASDSVSTIRDVMPLTAELAVYSSLRTQCKRCSTGAYILLSHGSYLCSMRPSKRIEDRMLLHVMASNTSPPPWRAPHLHHFCFTSPQPVRPKEASDYVSTIRDAMPLTVDLAMCFSLHTQGKHCSTGDYSFTPPLTLVTVLVENMSNCNFITGVG